MVRNWDPLSLWSVFTTYRADSFYSTILSGHHLLFSSALLWPVQILAETHPSLHGSSFLAHDPNTVGTFPVPRHPAGKVSTSLFLIGFFEEFATPIRRSTRVHCGQTSLYLKWFHSWLNEQNRKGSVNVYTFLSTAGVVLVEAPTPAVHGSSHGQTSFSGYLLPHVDPQHHSSPDNHTHHHNTPSTIFTPGRSWRYPYSSGSGLSTVTQGESHLECLSVNEVMDLDSESLS